jgi:hypothetical protein
MATLAATLEVAQIESIETIGGAELEVMSGYSNVLVIQFADENDRTAFLEAVKFVQSAHKEAK